MITAIAGLAPQQQAWSAKLSARQSIGARAERHRLGLGAGHLYGGGAQMQLAGRHKSSITPARPAREGPNARAAEP